MKNKSLFVKSVNILLAFFLTFSFTLSSTSFGVFAENTNDVTVSFDWFSSSGLALIPNVNLSSLYGVSGSKDFTGLITVDGTEKTVVYSVTGINLVLWGVKTTNASSTVEIKAGTVLTCAGVDPIRITKAFKLKKTNGIWAVEVNTNEVTVSFDWFSSSGLALLPSVNLSTLYGVTGSKDFSGLITVDGTEKTVVYSVTGVNLVLWGVKTTNASSTVEIKAGTVLTCTGADPIRITKTFRLKKTDGSWIVEENKNEITVSFDWFTTSGLALIPSTNLSTMYNVPSGGSKDFNGPITVDGTEKTVVYSVTGINLVLWGVKTTNASSTVEIKAGTVLTCASADSILITKALKLKKANGSWIVDTGVAIPEVFELGAVSAVNGHSSQISVNASVSDGGTLSYQWYDSGVLVSGASDASLTTTDFPAGVYYITCTVTNTNQGLQASATVSATLTVYDRGDVTLSGGISVEDIILIKNHMLGKEKLAGLNQKAADMDIDGEITIVDLLLTKQSILGTN